MYTLKVINQLDYDIVIKKKDGDGIVNHHYEGEFKNDRKHGQGREVDENGVIFVGDFKEGKRHGYGVRTWPTGDREQKGIWHDGEYVGSVEILETSAPAA